MPALEGIVRKFVPASLAEDKYLHLIDIVFKRVFIHALDRVEKIVYTLLDIALVLLQISVEIGKTPEFYDILEMPLMKFFGTTLAL